MNRLGAPRTLDSRGTVLISLAVIGFVGGVVRQVLAPGQPFAEADIPFALLGVAMVFAWYRMDAGQRGYRRSPLLDVMVVAVTILALPHYLFRTRGLLGGFRATGVLALAIVAYFVLQICGEYVAYYARELGLG